jgi:ABC-type transporter Mla subunit MlaD
VNAEDREAFEKLNDKVDGMIARFTAIEERVAAAWEKIEPLLSEVMPLMAKIEASPMFKMITAGGKKR